ncbi:DNA glycosylase AlkZ-like family protein [Paenibacillus sp. NPDC057934]|uniref:DNA glycosylase AlkZ-like family protein n=1 Tax=Paenibacillus sp. NPDC057934 TaxID=3346282 RepID=UPI0036DA2849
MKKAGIIITQPSYSKADIRKYLIAYHHLNDDSALQSTHQIAEYIRKVGCIQYDPLDVVGRNPDLTLQSRCAAYRKGDIDQYLYTERILFDVWDKNMSICEVSDWPSFKRFRERYLHWCHEHQETIDTITAYLREHETACSSDFALEERVNWHYGPQRLAKAALEAMCYAGLAVVHHKKGTRRYYGLADQFIPEPYFSAPAPYTTEKEFYKWFVLRRINSIGILWNRQSDAWLGINGLKSQDRNRAFQALLEEGHIREITVEGIKHPMYLSATTIELLESATERELSGNTARILAPLDNLMWDRKLIQELFGFEYTWEVYVPAPKRKYGYYILPVLCDEQMIGRIELETDKSSKTLIVKQFWPQPETNILDYRQQLLSGLERFKQYNLCDVIEISPDVRFLK